VQTI